MGNLFNGKKTYIGAALIAAAAVLNYLGYSELGDVLIQLGVALGLFGMAHKIAKHTKQ